MALVAPDHDAMDGGISWEKFASDILPDPTYNKMFSKHDFVQESFAVDLFVDHHKDQPLEELRELLSSYLKRLRVACLDLLNEDYTNFVHLSSTLFDLGKSIEKVHSPLIKAYEDIQNVKSRIESSCHTLVQKISLLKNIRRKITFIENLAQVLSEVSAIESRLKDFELLDQLEKRLVIEESLDTLTSAERFMKRNEIESETTKNFIIKIIDLLQFVKGYKNSSDYLTFPFEFLLQKKYD